MESGVIASVGTAGAGGTGITLTAPLKRAHPSATAIGKSGMSLTESRSHFGLWSMMAAPLIAGTDVVNIADENVAIVSDRDVLAVDQDPLGVQAAVVSNDGSHWTLKKPLSGGDTAIALFNAGASAWSGATVPLDAGTTYLAKDLWTKAVAGVRGGDAVAGIPAHATTLLRLTTAGPRIAAPSGPLTAQATEPTGIPVSFDTSGTDAFGTALAPDCAPASGATFPIGPTHVTCVATDAAGRTASASFEVDVLPPPHPLEVGGTVPATLSLTLGAPASFGAFTPGVEHDYTAQTTANVISTAGNATLSVSDPGHLANGGFTLPQPLRVEIARADGESLGAMESPVPASWTGPVSNAAVAITFRQAIGATDALRTGSYAKTLTFTLSTTAP
jgi:hypothetical protein